MRVPPFDRYPSLLIAAAIFATGFLTGCAAYLGLHQHHFNLVVVQNARLESELEQAREALRAQANLRSKQSTVSQVKVLLDPSQSDELDEWTENAIRKAVHEDFQSAIGSSATSIRSTPQVFLKLADGKIYTGIRGKEYRVRVETMVIVQSELTVWINAKGHVNPGL
ncbi:hypothetical protein [Gorillibacterium sp. CAU 1737]|uniref:hypothetical protein n=1 Tax=Gorillibacterium sp. CAU 1737 TaxID=3140362 RepID=UPI0032603E51